MAGAIRDIGTNLLPVDNTLITLTEIADTGKPVITEVTLNYSTGVMTTANETIDGNPPNLLNLSKIFLSDSSGAREIELTGAEFESQESTTVTITLTELQRVAAIPISGSQGGDAGAIVADFDSEAFQDMGTNKLDEILGVSVVETRDSIIPVVFNATINYSTGILFISSSETIDMTPASMIDLSKIFCQTQQLN